MSIVFASTGSFLGSNSIDNKKLFSMIKNFDIARATETIKKKGTQVDGLSKETIFDLWVKQVCGVERRVFFTKGQQNDNQGPPQLNEYMGYMAAKAALESGKIDPKRAAPRPRIELVIEC